MSRIYNGMALWMTDYGTGAAGMFFEGDVVIVCDDCSSVGARRCREPCDSHLLQRLPNHQDVPVPVREQLLQLVLHRFVNNCARCSCGLLCAELLCWRWGCAAFIKNQVDVFGYHQECAANSKGHPDCMAELCVLHQLRLIVFYPLLTRSFLRAGNRTWASSLWCNWLWATSRRSSCRGLLPSSRR